MNKKLSSSTKTILSLLVNLLLAASLSYSQTTAFTYQGSLTEGGNPANGAYQMQFKLYDSLAGGNQVGATIPDVNVTVANGVFSTKLDFGSIALSGANRWLEIAVRHTSSEFYTTLSPREQIASSPYAVRTISAANADNAANLGGIPANQYLTNATVGSAFVRNGTAPQTADFNISGSGSVGGNLGVGTSNPQSKVMAVTPSFSYGFTQTNGSATVGTYIDPTAGWLGTRSNHPLHLFTNGGLPIMTVGTNGNVGIGNISSTPTARLTVTGSGLFNSAGAARFDLFNSTSGSGYLQNVTDTGLWQLATTGGSTVMVANQSGNVGIGSTNPQARLQIAGTGANGFTLGVEGNAAQNRNSGGFVKASISISAEGAILRCYNGMTGAATGNCGFSVTRFTAGGYGIDFGFQVNDRFVSVTPGYYNPGGVLYIGSASFFFPVSPTTVNVRTSRNSENETTEDVPFMIIVF